MKTIFNSKPQLVTKVIYLIPVLLIYTVGLCVAHVLSSESDIKLAYHGNNRLIDRPVHAIPVPASSEKSSAEAEIEPFQDALRRIARANADKALNATRQSVLNELQENVAGSFYAFKRGPDDMQLVADRDGNKSLDATRQTVLNEVRDNISGSLNAYKLDTHSMQLVADRDGNKSLNATRQMVAEELKVNVSDLFHDQFQYLGDPGIDEKQIATEDTNDQPLPGNAGYKLADRSQ